MSRARTDWACANFVIGAVVYARTLQGRGENVYCCIRTTFEPIDYFTTDARDNTNLKRGRSSYSYIFPVYGQSLTESVS